MLRRHWSQEISNLNFLRKNFVSCIFFANLKFKIIKVEAFVSVTHQREFENASAKMDEWVKDAKNKVI